jgi:uncharacterized protein
MQAFFLQTGKGQRFCVHHAAQGEVVRGRVLYIHPFAQEMNKSRRMAALQARSLASAGFEVLQIDLLGCGDSSGDFGDATWQDWVDDVVGGCKWLENNAPKDAPLWLWGLRAGCLLATQAAQQWGQACQFLFWQAPASGKLLLQQFLRLKVAGEMLKGQANVTLAQARQQLEDGHSLDIAGYCLSPGLAAGLGQATLSPPRIPGRSQSVVCFEVVANKEAGVGAAMCAHVLQWQEAGLASAVHVATGPAFWQSVEIEEAPALIEATTAALIRASHR